MVPVVAIIILLIFSVACYPVFNPKPKNIPITVVNADKGIKIQDKEVHIGKNLESKLMNSDSDTVKWIKVDHEVDLKQGMQNKDDFSAIVIEKDFSKHAMSHTQSVVENFKKQEMEAKVKSGEMPLEVAQQMVQKTKCEATTSDIQDNC